MNSSIFPLSLFSVILMAGCTNGGGDGASSATDPTAADTGNGTDDPTGMMPTTGSSDPTGEPGSESGSGSASGSETGVDECTDADECRTAEDCGAGQTCVACGCFGDVDVCADEPIAGQFVQCGETSSFCGANPMQSLCVRTGERDSACFFLGCEEACDCPTVEGFADQVQCTELLQAPGKECSIRCGADEPCPEGMACHPQSGFCQFAEQEVLPVYGACLNELAVCGGQNAFCLPLGPQNQPPAVGACSQECADAEACPDPAEGVTATKACHEFQTRGPDSLNACVLYCDAEATCPPGAQCVQVGPMGSSVGMCLYAPN